MLLVLAFRMESYSFCVASCDPIPLAICVFHQNFNNIIRHWPCLKIFVQNILHIVGMCQGFVGQLVDHKNSVKALHKMKEASPFHS